MWQLADMSAILKRIDDPREPLAKYSRKELEHLARYEGREDIHPDMPAELMRDLFRRAPPTRWPKPMRATLGTHQRLVVPPFQDWVRIAVEGREPPPREESEGALQSDPLTVLRESWAAQQSLGEIPPPEPVFDELGEEVPVDYESMKFWQLKQEVAKLGIHVKRTYNKKQLIGILNGQDPARCG